MGNGIKGLRNHNTQGNAKQGEGKASSWQTSATHPLDYAGPVGGLDRSTEQQVKRLANATAEGLAQQLDSMKVVVNGAG